MRQPSLPRFLASALLLAGAAVTHYLVSATGAFTGSFPITARTFSSAARPGVYNVSIAAVGPCGTSVPTPAVTVEVR